MVEQALQGWVAPLVNGDYKHDYCTLILFRVNCFYGSKSALLHFFFKKPEPANTIASGVLLFGEYNINLYTPLEYVEL